MLRKMQKQKKFDDYYDANNKKIEKNNLILLYNTQNIKNQNSIKKIKI